MLEFSWRDKFDKIILQFLPGWPGRCAFRGRGRARRRGSAKENAREGSVEDSAVLFTAD